MADAADAADGADASDRSRLAPGPARAGPQPTSQPTSQPTPKQGTGCWWALVAAPIALVAGLVAGSVLSRGGGGPEEISRTIAEGTAGSLAWHVTAERDIEGDTCAFLYLEDEKLTGACTTAPQDATLDDGPTPADRVTVVFGKAPRAATRVRVGLEEDGGRRVDPLEVDTVEAGPVAGRYYVAEVPGDLDVTGTLEVLAE